MATLSTPWRDGGDAAHFRDQYPALLPPMHFNYSAINPVAVKSLMQACGLPVGSLPKPLRGLDPAALSAGIHAIRELELDKRYGYDVRHRAV